jgi:hypothetical protein
MEPQIRRVNERQDAKAAKEKTPRKGGSERRGAEAPRRIRQVKERKTVRP